MNDKKEDLCIYRIRNAVETLGVAVLCLESQPIFLMIMLLIF